MIPVYRVSNLAQYARWRDNEGDGIGWLYDAIFKEESTEAMTRGTAFHAALEKVCEGEHATVTANGYTFAFTCDAEISLPRTREIRQSKDYGGIIVTGKCDGIEGKRIIDHKTTQQFDAERYMEGWQHGFYLDIFGADRFDWHIWEVGQVESDAYEVYAHHLLTQFRYPGMEEDCRELAHEFRDFAARLGWKGLPDAIRAA
jgi:hypothetical protein